MSLAVLVPRVSDDLAGEGEELVSTGEEIWHHVTQLSRRLIYAHLSIYKDATV